MDNAPFKEHSWYFRNALVRANYENLQLEVHPTREYLDCFFDNLLLGGHHDLKNRYLHIDWQGDELRTERLSTDQVTQQVTQHVTQHVTQQVSDLLTALGDQELSLRSLMERLNLRDRNNFTKNYLNPALEAGLIERTIPDKPTSKLQKYRVAKRTV